MTYSNYDNDNIIKKLNIQIGMNWADIKTDREDLISIFREVDDGDGIVQENELTMLNNRLNEMSNNTTQPTENKNIQKMSVKDLLKKLDDEQWLKENAIDYMSLLSGKELISLTNEYNKKDRKKYLLEKISKLDNIPDKDKAKFLSEAQEKMEKELGYSPEYTDNNSQVKTKFYKSDKAYSVNFKDNIITVEEKSENNQTYTIDLNKLLKEVPIDMHPALKASLQKVPAEVLKDFAIECDHFADPRQEEWMDGGAIGLFDQKNDKIILGLTSMSSISPITLVHELGHAIDFRENRSKTPNTFRYMGRTLQEASSENNNKFKNAYDIATFKALDLEKYMTIDPETYEYSFDNEKLQKKGLLDQNGKFIKQKLNYISADQYMFKSVTECAAEMYTFAMLGKTESSNASYVTPELMNEYLKMLNETRALDDNDRHTRQR